MDERSRIERALTWISLFMEGRRHGTYEGNIAKMDVVDDAIRIMIHGKINHPINSVFTKEEQERIDALTKELTAIVLGKDGDR